MRIWTLCWLLLATPVLAQSTAPFELEHPITKEAGVWIPIWVQKLHLETDAALKTCSLERSALNLKIDVQHQELFERQAAYTELTTAIKALNVQLVSESLRAAAAEDTSEKRLSWALIASSAAVVAVIVVAIQAL